MVSCKITPAVLGVVLLSATAPVMATPGPSPSPDTIEKRAFRFFWYESDPVTGLTRDRARNRGNPSGENNIASIAATGYALAAIPIGVSRGWVTRQEGYSRTLLTLRFLNDRVPNEHGFYYHFLDIRTGARAWRCELSSIDTALLLMGARVVSRFWPGTAVQRMANTLTDRADWRWMQTDGGPNPRETALSMGWKPETGFLPSRWQGYSEAFFLYILALGSRTHPLSPSAWDQWRTPAETLEGLSPVFGGAQPLFTAQMAPGFLNVQGTRDRQGRDWWTAWANAHRADQAYCARNPEHRKNYAEGFWGITSSDLPPPAGYGANRPSDRENDGTVAPSAMLAGVLFTPDAAAIARRRLWELHGTQLWGRYGYSNAFNVDKGWYDPDVIGIDLGMTLLALENSRTGLIWRLMGGDPVLARGLSAAGFHRSHSITLSRTPGHPSRRG